MKLDISQIIEYDDTKDKQEYKKFILRGIATVTLTKAPTANCQLYSIGSAESILAYDNALEIFAYFHRILNKNRILLDVEEKYKYRVEDIFGLEHKVIKDEYSNSKYGTKMILYIFGTNKLAEYNMNLIKNAQDNVKAAEANVEPEGIGKSARSLKSMYDRYGIQYVDNVYGYTTIIR